MADSRLLKLGTVYTRVKGLMRGGALKWEDRPLWYDVYEAFPPKLNPVMERPAVMKEIEDIMYPEDIIRAQFYKRYTSPGVINLASPVGQTLAQKFTDTYLKLSKDPSNRREDLFQISVSALAAQGTVFQERAVRNPPLAFRRREVAAGSPPGEEIPLPPKSESSESSFSSEGLNRQKSQT